MQKKNRIGLGQRNVVISEKYHIKLPKPHIFDRKSRDNHKYLILIETSTNLARNIWELDLICIYLLFNQPV